MGTVFISTPNTATRQRRAANGGCGQRIRRKRAGFSASEDAAACRQPPSAALPMPASMAGRQMAWNAARYRLPALPDWRACSRSGRHGSNRRSRLCRLGSPVRFRPRQHPSDAAHGRAERMVRPRRALTWADHQAAAQRAPSRPERTRSETPISSADATIAYRQHAPSPEK
jgi:hypothetical protein